MPGGAAQTRKELDGWQDWAKARGAKGLAYVLFDAETGSSVRLRMSKSLLEAYARLQPAEPNSTLDSRSQADPRVADDIGVTNGPT